MNVLNIILLLFHTLLCIDFSCGLFWPKALASAFLHGADRNPYYGNGYYGGGGGQAYHHRPQKRRGGGRRSGRTYNDIARFVNPNPYAFPGVQPYPAQPLWSSG